MIRRVHITGYKSLRDVTVELRPLSALMGPNAAGKSNFLDALQLLSRAVTARTLGEAFEPPYRGTPLESFSFGPNGLAGQLQLSDRTLNGLTGAAARARRHRSVDIKDLSRGSKIYFPVYAKGGGLSMGDLHFSQGDGRNHLSAAPSTAPQKPQPT